jgi:hypothetical protein
MVSLPDLHSFCAFYRALFPYSVSPSGIYITHRGFRPWGHWGDTNTGCCVLLLLTDYTPYWRAPLLREHARLGRFGTLLEYQSQLASKKIYNPNALNPSPTQSYPPITIHPTEPKTRPFHSIGSKKVLSKSEQGSKWASRGIRGTICVPCVGGSVYGALHNYVIHLSNLLVQVREV